MTSTSTRPISIEQQLADIPNNFPVVVLMQSAPSQINTWDDYQWQAVGVMVRNSDDIEQAQSQSQLVHDQNDTRQYLYSGFSIRLYIDECESYYYNLIADTPRCFVITRRNESGVPIPFLVSMSFDEANAYLESDEDVYVVDVPPEIYRWTEAFVLMHYAPEKRKKRQRDDWKQHGEPELNP